ncbi:MAG: ParA family protein [Hyphomicrobiaceae bacterium]|nr:MAG: ParA family protein [Hyphomicrobiaceae bacterium]
MGPSIAVMNAKGGVGKSTVVMSLAETLSVYHRKNVLVIDSDSQTSISVMLMHMSRWEELERAKRTLVDYLAEMVLGEGKADWKDFVATRVSDVEDAEGIYLIPSHMELSLFEREISGRQLYDRLAMAARALLDDASRYFDLIFIDCPPGISILTETWLRQCDFFLPPTKADYLSNRGLSIIHRYRDLARGGRFADNLGILINQKDGRVKSEEEWHQRMLADPESRCFTSCIPRRAYIQRAADFDATMRTYMSKYPGDAGDAMRNVAAELIERIADPSVRSAPHPSNSSPASPAEEAAAVVRSATPPPIPAAAEETPPEPRLAAG